MSHRVYAITRELWLGAFPTPQRQQVLLAAGITHILNVSDASSATVARGTFREVCWHPLADLQTIPPRSATECLQALHRMVCETGSRIYVHCIAGQNRSPTVVWLYFIACGYTAVDARAMIESRAPDAIPGHRTLVDESLISSVQRLGRDTFLPHPRPEIFVTD